MELEQKRQEFERQGLHVASLSYDQPAVLRNFAGRKNITFTMLSDPESKVIRAFGILNETIPAATPFHGVPYPGMYVIDARGIVKAKFFEDDFRDRFMPATVLVHQFGDSSGWQRTTVETKHLTVSYSSGDTVVHPGSRTALLVEVQLKPGMHVYAPGVQEGYIPIAWDMAANPAITVHPPELPASRTLHLPVIDETVPVYEGRFRLLRDITFSETAKPGEVQVEGSFRYQACDDKVCYTPQVIPLKWTFRIEPHDRVRVPLELRRVQ